MFFCKVYGFSFVFGWISGKMDQKRKFWAIAGSFGAAKNPYIVARPRGKVGPASGSSRRSHCSQHGNVVFCFVLFFHCSEDLSTGLIRTL